MNAEFYNQIAQSTAHRKSRDDNKDFIFAYPNYLKDELTEILSKKGIKIGNVLRRPIDGLIAYHVLNNKKV